MDGWPRSGAGTAWPAPTKRRTAGGERRRSALREGQGHRRSAPSQEGRCSTPASTSRSARRSPPPQQVPDERTPGPTSPPARTATSSTPSTTSTTAPAGRPSDASPPTPASPTPQSPRPSPSPHSPPGGLSSSSSRPWTETLRSHELWLAASIPHSGAEPPPRIAGRRAELDVVRRHLETGSGLLLVTGEAGIGKTTVVTHAAAQVGRFVSLAHCRPLSGQVSFLPVADVLRSTLETDAGAWFSAALDTCPAFVARALAQLLPELDDVPEPSPPPSPTSGCCWRSVRRWSPWTPSDRWPWSWRICPGPTTPPSTSSSSCWTAASRSRWSRPGGPANRTRMQARRLAGPDERIGEGAAPRTAHGE